MIVVYVVAYRLRFPGVELSGFLPAAIRLLPLVLGCEILAFDAAGLYRTQYLGRGFFRVVIAAAAGATAAATITQVAVGFEGLSRLSFVIDAALLIMGACTWRGLGVLRQLARHSRAAEASGTPMIDRSDPITWIGTGLFGIFHYRELLRNLVLRDLRLKYRGSVLGFAWSMANPLTMAVVYTFAFTYVLRASSEGFVFRLLVGILTWTFFANSANMSTGSILDSGDLIKGVFFPRAILPIATVLFNLSQFLLAAVVFLPLLLVVFRRPLAAPMLLFPVFLALQLLFTIGVALTLSTCTAFFRDVKHLLEVSLALMFWTTPIVYDIARAPESLRTPILLSPMSPYIIAYQRMFYDGAWPSAAVTLVASLYALVALTLGTVVFVAYEDRFAEQV